MFAPVIFTLYTADCRTQDVSHPLTKFADDTAMFGLIHNNDDTKYQLRQKSFVDYCNTNCHQLNITNTMEMFMHIRRTALSTPLLSSAVLKSIESSYKYLGVHLNDCLSWSDQVDAMIKKLNNILCCIGTLARFNVRTDIINIFHNATIGEVLRYCLVAWCGNATKADMEPIDSIIRKERIPYFLVYNAHF